MPAFDRLFDDAVFAGFYDLDNGWGADLEYCTGLARDATSVLDLGCGTGALAVSLGATRRVTGASSRAMRARSGSARPSISW
jgi:ubiquinone/menaquinone biosynthesis C-methylase UbiE